MADATAMTVTIRLEDGAYWATVAEYPGVFATGDTVEELTESLTEGIGLWLAPEGHPPAHVEIHGLGVEPPQVDVSAQLSIA